MTGKQHLWPSSLISSQSPPLLSSTVSITFGGIGLRFITKYLKVHFRPASLSTTSFVSLNIQEGNACSLDHQYNRVDFLHHQETCPPKAAIGLIFQ